MDRAAGGISIVGGAGQIDGERDRFIAGDPLRGLAALGVLIIHAGGAALVATGNGDRFTHAVGRLDAYGDVVGSLTVAGYFGVWIFFVLSGYLIGRPFARALVHGRERPSIARFARNRALRILPAYWTVLTLVLVFVVVLTGEVEVSTGQLATLYGLLLPDENPLLRWTAHIWTLEAEAKFYVAVPIAALVAAPALRRLPTERSRALAIAMPCAAWVVAAPVVQDELVGTSFLWLVRFFVAGIAIAALEPLARPWLAERERWAAAATGIFTVSALYVLAFPALYLRVGGAFDASAGKLALNLSISGIVGGALLRQWAGAGCWRLLDNPVTRWLGSRSYSFYVVHLPLVWELSELLAETGDGYKTTFALLLIAAIPATALAAELLYRAVERPFLERKRRSRAATGRQSSSSVARWRPRT